MDSIAGGGGLISLPALLMAGISPAGAIATNKLQSSFGSFSSSLNYIRKGQVRPGELRTGIICVAVGATAGALIIDRLDPGFLAALLPVLLALVFLYTLLAGEPPTPDQERHPRWFFPLAGTGLGFYDGFFGPGTGSFWMALLRGVSGMTLLRAAACTRILNFTSNIVSLLVFAAGDRILWTTGALMGLACFAGARLGSSMAVRRGAALIRPLFLLVVFLSLIKVSLNTYA